MKKLILGLGILMSLNVQAMSSENHVYFSTNFVGLTKGAGNAGADFMITDKWAASFRFKDSSEAETVIKDGESMKLTVYRKAYVLGASYYTHGLTAPFTLIFSPGLAFGAKSDALESETASGLGMKVSALLRMQENFAVELGLSADTLKDSLFIGEPHVGVGYLF